MATKTQYIGYIRYTGPSVESGYLDARKSAEALLGFDEALRYFVGKQDNQLAKLDYEIPVRVQKGSWQALIPHDISSWIMSALGIVGTAYLATAAKKMAENDFKAAGFVPIFTKSLQAMQWILKIGKHLGTLSKRTFDNVRWRNGNQEMGIPNSRSEYLFVPIFFIDLYEQIPAHILRKIASLVSENRTLDIGVWKGGKDEIESLDIGNKAIFCPDTDDVLFPELQHGKKVKLTGLVTRGNENANSIGFQYLDHILTCYPKDGSVVRYKPALFLKCEIVGEITRENKLGEPIELRPKTIFSNLKPLQKEPPENKQPSLFDDDK